jgi:hypothetical protein
MSDRRSFSEIPAEQLRDHGAPARIDRVWERLAGELPAAAASRRRPVAYALALGAITFALGLFVGVRWVSREPIPFAALGAEPAEQWRPAAVAGAAAPHLAPSSEGVPPSHPAHRNVSRHVDAVPTSEEVLPAPEPMPVAAPASSASWQRLADEGQYAQALVALESSGGFDAALHEATADQLMSLVDVARATGQRDRAIVALRRIVSEHGADPNAPVAAWMLGNELAKVRDLTGAEQAFAMYRALSPNGDFAEDALGRQFDIAADQGNRDHARRLAEQYLKEFPDGPRTADIQSQLERWAKAPVPGAPAAPSHDVPAAIAPDAGVPR